MTSRDGNGRCTDEQPIVHIKPVWQSPTLTELDLLDTATGQAGSFDGIGYSGIQADV